ncbi:ATP-binding protein, partial [Thermoproteota archaeon]
KKIVFFNSRINQDFIDDLSPGKNNDLFQNFFSEQEGLHKTITPVYIQDICHEIIGLVKEPCETLKITIEKELKKCKKCIVEKDKIKLALLNIVFNSMEALGFNGRIMIAVSETVFKDSNCTMVDGLCVSISDTGPGISESDINKIFLPYFTTKTERLGLGLAVAQRVVHKHQGLITCEANPSQGTTMSVYLPYTRSIKQKNTIKNTSEKRVLAK